MLSPFGEVMGGTGQDQSIEKSTFLVLCFFLVFSSLLWAYTPALVPLGASLLQHRLTCALRDTRDTSSGMEHLLPRVRLQL